MTAQAGSDYHENMVTLRDIHRYQTARRLVQLDDGRVGKIVRVDTTFPGNSTVVSVYTLAPGGGSLEGGDEPEAPVEGADRGGRAPERGPGVARVGLDRIVGPANASA